MLNLVQHLLMRFRVKPGMTVRCGFFLCTLFLLFTASNSNAQYQRALTCYNNYQYSEAIPLFLKSLDGKNSAEATERLAHSYRILKKYPEAEMHYSRLLQISGYPPTIHFHYGEVLMNNGKYEEASRQFLLYDSLVPGDSKGKLMAKATLSIRELINQNPDFIVYSLSGINSGYSDFSPAVYDGGVLFSSDRPAVTNYVSPAAGRQQPEELSLWFAKKIDSISFADPRLFSDKLNSAFHNGPATTSADGNILIFTRVEKKKSGADGVSRPQLYSSTKKNNKWASPAALLFNSDDYSCIHPALSADGNSLYFASDMPGGYGGTDIYVSKKEGETWSAPRNLGPFINTSRDESFPYLHKDGTLYFSSNGHAGLGGLDVFSAAKSDEKWDNVQSLLAPVNSSADDFGIAFYNDSSGYFSSNRSGGDDMYGFTRINKKISVAGRILLSENITDPATNVKILLLTGDGTVVQSTTTDNSGFFNFENLPADSKYVVKLDEADPRFAAFKKIYLTDEKNNLVKKTTTDSRGRFVFYNLPVDPNSIGAMVEDDTRIAISGSLLAGEPTIPVTNQAIYLTDETGEIIHVGETDMYGNFRFEHLPADQKFLITLKPDDTKLKPNTKVVITDSRGKTIRIFYTDAHGGFDFEVLAIENNPLRLIEEDDTELRIDLQGRLAYENVMEENVGEAKINLLDEDGSVVQTVTTDEQGNFAFTQLPPDRNYLITMAESDIHFKPNSRMVIMDKKGNKVTTVVTDAKGGFKYEALASETAALKTESAEDTELNINIRGRLASETGETLANAKVNLTDENGKIVQTTTTDAKGSFSFSGLRSDRHFIVSLDEADTQLPPGARVNITDDKGKKVGAMEKDPKGAFGYKFLASSDNYLAEKKEEDTFLKKIFKGKLFADEAAKKPVINTTIYLMDESGKVIQSAKTDEGGGFGFSNLLAGQNFLFNVNEKEVPAGIKKLYLTDENGSIIKIIAFDKGKFQFDLLSADMQLLASIESKDTRLNIKRKEITELHAENIYYDYGRWHLHPEAISILDFIAKAMKENPDVGIEIASHTDMQSSAAFNLDLSQKRAKAAVDYLISKGVDAKRIKSRGMGKARPVKECPDESECPDEFHRANRRTEFRFIQ